MVTQLDVARRAGVGRRTVSNVVTGFPYVSKDVRERVLQAIDELGYVPNRAAQRLRTGRSGFIALLVPEVGVGYFGEISNLIVEEAAGRGLGTVVAQTRGSRDRELNEIERILAVQPDGLIVSPLGLSEEDLSSLQERCPVALIGEHLVDTSVRPAVIDNERAAFDVVSHLLSTGRREIAFVGITADAPRFTTLRREGYRRALRAAGRKATHEFPTAGFDYDDGARAGAKLVERNASRGRIDAVFCATDGLAIGVLRALHDAGLRVPADIAVAGFDDIAESRFVNPRLTTVAPDKAEIARRAVAAILDDVPIDGPVEFRLEVRESTVGPDATSNKTRHQRL